MKIGLTYDLRDDYEGLGFDEEALAEFDNLQTVEALESALTELGYQTERIGHVRYLVRGLAAGRRWDMVFNIAEGLNGFGRESQVPALLEAYGIPYTFSDPLTLSVTLHKGMAKSIVRDRGISTPDFALVESAADIARVDLAYPLFAKPVAEGTGKGITSASKIVNEEQLAKVCFRLLEKYQQPVLIEAFLPGREFTVGITGTGASAEVAGVMEVILRGEAEADVYSYMNKELCEERVTYLPALDQEADRVGSTALAAYRALGCRDAGRVDLRSDAFGEPMFLEINPLAGLHPEHSDLPILCTLHGIGFVELIGRIMSSAMTRSTPVLRKAVGW